MENICRGIWTLNPSRYSSPPSQGGVLRLQAGLPTVTPPTRAHHVAGRFDQMHLMPPTTALTGSWQDVDHALGNASLQGQLCQLQGCEWGHLRRQDRREVGSAFPCWRPSPALDTPQASSRSSSGGKGVTFLVWFGGPRPTHCWASGWEVHLWVPRLCGGWGSGAFQGQLLWPLSMPPR